MTRSTRPHVFVQHHQHPREKQKQRGNNGMTPKHEGHPKDCKDESNQCHLVERPVGDSRHAKWPLFRLAGFPSGARQETKPAAGPASQATNTEKTNGEPTPPAFADTEPRWRVSFARRSQLSDYAPEIDSCEQGNPAEDYRAPHPDTADRPPDLL